MANAKLTIKIIEFFIEEDLTICNLYYVSNEASPIWGGGWKTKTFGKDRNVAEFIQDDVSDFIEWENGRNE